MFKADMAYASFVQECIRTLVVIVDNYFQRYLNTQ